MKNSKYTLTVIGILVWVSSVIASPVSAAPYTNQLITNGGFENEDQINNDWNCEIGAYYKTFICLIIASIPDDETNSVRLGMAGSEESSVHTSVFQYVTIPDDAVKARLNFDYKWDPSETEDTDPGFYSDHFTVTVWNATIDDDPYLFDERYVPALFMPETEAANDEWQHVSVDVSPLIGDRVKVYFGVENKDADASYAYIDNIKLRVKSVPEYAGTVVDGSGSPVHKAQVTVRSLKGKILWRGRTNKKGKFTATGINGSTKKRKISVSSTVGEVRFRKTIKWGKTYSQEIIVE